MARLFKHNRAVKIAGVGYEIVIKKNKNKKL